MPLPLRQSPIGLRALALLLLLAAPAAVAGGARAQEGGPAATKGATPGTTAYTAEVTGVEEDSLRDLLRDVSRLIGLRKDPPPSPLGLRRRADADRERLAAALRSEGYYQASLDIQVDTGVEPATVAIRVDPGPRYTIAGVEVRAAGAQAIPGDPIGPQDLDLPLGAPARGPAVQSAGDAISGILARRSHAFARVVDRQVQVNHAQRTMRVVYVVDPGPSIRLGDARVDGLERVEEDAVLRRLRYDRGERYDPALLEETRQALVDLGVFTAVRVRLGDPDAEGVAPVEITVQERAMRFVGFGVSYGTEDGLAANVYWGHRNLLGGAERFRVGASIAGVGRSDFTDPGAFDYILGATFTERDFLVQEQTLDLTVQAISERPDAYRRNALVLSGIVTRPIASGLTGSLGLTLEQSRVDDGVVATTNTLLGAPGALTFDRTDDPLDPSRGFRLNAAVTPWFSLLGDSGSFLVSRLGGSTYFDLTGERTLVAAVRGTYGAVVGLGGLLDVPADKRFYAGGGGSIRGFGFQEVGPRDPDGEPLGGLSLLELSTELRYRVSESVGLVGFIDGGNVYRSEYPSFGEELRWGAGVGVRYFTAIGPIRADFAVPLNRRDGDGAWALYVSIGQAF